MIRCRGDDVSNVLYLLLQEDRLIATTEAFAPHCSIDIAADGSPVGITIVGYFTEKVWPITQELMTKFHLEPWDGDLKVAYKGLFNPFAGLGEMKVVYDPIEKDG